MGPRFSSNKTITLWNYSLDSTLLCKEIQKKNYGKIDEILVEQLEHNSKQTILTYLSTTLTFFSNNSQHLRPNIALQINFIFAIFINRLHEINTKILYNPTDDQFDDLIIR
jgi:hypothetical protein